MIGPYLAIARVSHWSKNLFLVPGALLVYALEPGFYEPSQLGGVFVGLASACLVSSGNYVLNELLDAGTDVHHPIKSRRMVPTGRIDPRLAYAEWLVLLALGFGLAFAWNPGLGWSAVLLAIMGTLYNLPPFRLKDRVYVDTLSESINNPIRLAMGWHATGQGGLPPVSALVAYWMFGALLMGLKRLAEYRAIGDHARAALYRKSFAQWSEPRLVAAAVVFAVLFGGFSLSFSLTYRPELLLAAPLVAWAMAHYVRLALAPDSPVQYPEGLYREPKLMALVAAAFLASAILMLVRIPFVGQLVTGPGGTAG